MKYLLRSVLFICSLFTVSFLRAQPDCTDYSEATLTGDTVCANSVNAYVVVKNTVKGKTYQAYWGEKAVGASALGSTDGGQLILSLPINNGFNIGKHVISLRSSAAVCPANTAAGDTAMVVINEGSIDHLKVKGDTICDNSASATITIQNTRVSEIFQLFQGSVAFGLPLKGNGSDIVISVPREKLVLGQNAFYVRVSIIGCNSLYLNEFGTILVNAMPSVLLSATAISPICEGNATVISVPASSLGAVYQVFQDATLVAEAIGTGSTLSIPVPASYLVIGRNVLSIKATIQVAKGCAPLFLTLSLVVVVNASPTITFKLEKDTVIAYETDSFAQIVIFSSDRGLVFGGIEGTSLMGTVQVGSAKRDTLKLPIGKGTNQLSIGTHTIIVKALVNGCTAKEFKDTVIVIINPVLSNGLEESSANVHSRVWPNPFASELYINVPSQLKEVRLRIADALGATLHEQKIRSGEITLPTHWPSGVYYLEISGENYKEQIKLVK